MDMVRCSTCPNLMEVLDAHTNCAECLGIPHLREAMTDPCPSCALMPLAVRQARLAGMERNSSNVLVSDAQMQRKRRHSPVRVKQHKKSKPSELERKVELLSSTVERLLPLLARPPPSAGPQVGNAEEQPAPPTSLSPACSRSPTPDQEEVMSVAASDTLFSQAPLSVQPPGDVLTDDVPHDMGSDTMSGRSGESSSVAGSVEATLKALLARLQLDTPGTGVTGSENMFLRRAQRAALVVPQCRDFTSVVASALAAAKKSARPDQMSRMLATMQDPDEVGLGSMPVIEPSVASLIVSPDEALRENVRCPNAECRRTDELLSRAYSSTAFLGRVSNSLAHMLVMLHSSLSNSSSDPLATEVLELALQALGVVANQCGTTLGTLVQARRQVWLAQSPLPEVCRNNLRHLPLAPGQLFGPAAQEALDRRVSATESRSRHVSVAPTFRAPPNPAASRLRHAAPRATQRSPNRPQQRAPNPPPAPPRHGGAQSRVSFRPFRQGGPPRHRRPPIATEKRRPDH